MDCNKADHEKLHEIIISVQKKFDDYSKRAKLINTRQ